ncbi:MAG: tetratricopeptide repeat protein [Sporichthyaceae bacterium]
MLVSSECWAAIGRADALLELGRAQAALDLLGVALGSDPEEPGLWCRIARAQLALDREAEALEAAGRGVGYGADPGWPHRLRSVAFARLGRQDDALLAVRAAVEAEADEWRNHYWLAYTLATYTVARPPGTSEVWWGIEEARLRSDLTAAATRTVELAPEEALAHLALARAKRRRGDSKGARAAADHALALAPNDTVVHTTRVRILEQDGLTDTIRNLSRLAALDPAGDAAAEHQDKSTTLAFSGCLVSVLAWLVVSGAIQLLIPSQREQIRSVPTHVVTAAMAVGLVFPAVFAAIRLRGPDRWAFLRALHRARFEVRLAAVGTLLFLISGGTVPGLSDTLAFWALVLLVVFPHLLWPTHLPSWHKRRFRERQG